MLLAMDVGNTNIKIGVFNGDDITYSWRISVNPIRTADEYGTTLLNLFSMNNMNAHDVEGIIISSVVPSINYTLEHMATYYFNIKPIMVSSSIKTGLKFDYYDSYEIGADRIVNAVAAFNIYKAPLIVVDMGTATTFGVVDEKGTFLGGAIAPGLKSSLDALAGNAARLRRIEITQPLHIIGRSTVENMQSGAIYGFYGLVSHMIKVLKSEMNSDNIMVIATGGLSELIENDNERIFDCVDRALTLKGLKILYEMNK